MRDRTRHPSLPDEADTTRDAGASLRQPVIWLGGLIFFLSLAACVATIVLALRHADAPVETGSRVMGVPVQDTAAPRPAPEAK